MGLFCATVLTMIFFAVALAAPRWVISLFNQEAAVIETGSHYLAIVSFSYPAVALMTMFSTVLRNTERVKLPMYVSIITTIANAFLDYGLIYGAFGLPALGVKGAALATCITSWLGPVLVLAFSLAEKNLLTGPLRELCQFTAHDFGGFCARALPVMLNEGMWALGMVVLNMIYSNIGYEYYAGMTIFKTFADLAFSFYLGLGNSCVIMVGKSIGQGKIKRGIEDATRFSFLVPLLGMVVGGLVVLLRYPLISVFSNGSTLSDITLQTALSVTVFCSLEVWFRNVSYVQIVGVFRSGGDTLTGMICDLASLWLVALPLAYLAANVWHLPFFFVVVCAYLGEDIPKSIACIIHFRRMKWLKPVTAEGRAGLEEYRRSE